MLIASTLAGCGEHPEVLLSGRWRESGWEYEKFVAKPAVQGKWVDGIDLPGFAERSVIHHEAEYWDFRPGGALVIAKRDGSHLRARWRLKGRGHVLTVRGPGNTFEVYDVKGLDRDELVLNYDVGMEVRGIARLTFRRVEAGGSAGKPNIDSSLARPRARFDHRAEFLSALHPARKR